MEQGMKSATGGEPNPLESTGLCLLSFDGGGVRGLSSLYILQGLMKRLNAARKQAKLAPVKPCEIFDLMGGTSTGGLIAIMLGRLEMSVEECITKYIELMTSVFSEKASRLPVSWSGKVKAIFDSSKLAAAVKKVITDCGLPEDAKLNDGEDRGCRVFVCATAKETKGTTRLRSYESVGGFGDIPATILEAALATSAASSYFDPVVIGSRTFVDGGLRANNPVEQVEEEASDIWCETSGSLQPLVKCFISIGTGNPGKKALEDNIAKFLSKSLVEIATETEATAERFAARWRESLESHRYFRYNVDQGLQEVDLAEYKSANVIETTTAEYMGEQRQKSSVLHCVQNLERKQNWTPRDFAEARRAVLSSEEKRKIFAWISDMSFSQKLTDTYAKREPGTGEWFLQLEEFRGWRDDRSGISPVLWCPGMPGAGKSVMSSLVIRHLQEKFGSKASVSYVFCEHKDRNNQTTERLLSSLFSQVVLQSENVPDEVVDTFTKGLQLSMDATVRLLIAAGQSFERSFIVVDALDEHIRDDEEENAFRMKFVDGLLLLCGPTPNMGGYSLIFTSRENPSIEEQLHGCQRIEIRAQEADIRSFVTSAISRNRVLNTQTKKDPGFEADLVDTIVNNSQGMFLLPSLHMRRLGAQTNIRNVRKELKTLPKTLDDTYSEAMVRIRNQDESHTQLALRTLMWVYHSMRPLEIDEVRHALATDDLDDDFDEDALDDPASIVSFSAGLLTLNMTTKIISWAHLSVGDFLFRTYDQWSAGGADKQITTTCLRYLSFKTFAGDDVMTTEQLDAREREFRLLDYAAQFWAPHAKRSPENDVVEPIMNFLDRAANIRSAVEAIKLVNPHASIYKRDIPRHGLTALMLAAHYGLEETVKALLAKDADVGAIDDAGTTPLQYAAEQGHVEIAQLLVNHGANLYSKNFEDQTALYLATMNNQTIMTKKLLELEVLWAGRSNGEPSLVNIKQKEQGMAPLVDAVARGRVDLINMLLDAGANINDTTKERNTPLMIAAWNVQEASVRILIGRGADISLENEDGTTALHNETIWGPLTMLSFMLEHGADPDKVDNRGDTPLMQARQFHLTKVVELFENFKQSKLVELKEDPSSKS